MIDDGGLASRDADAPPWLTDYANARRCDGMRIPVALHESDNPDMRRCLRCGLTCAYENDVDRYCQTLRTDLWTPRPWSDDRWDIGHSQASPYTEHVDALNERDVADRLREPLVSAAVSAVWPKVDEVWERVPRIDALQLGRWLAQLGTLLAVIATMNVAMVWLLAEQERERAEQHDAIEQRLREMERQNAVMLDRLDVRERDTVRYDEQLDAWVVIERAR